MNELVLKHQVTSLPGKEEWALIREQAMVAVKSGFLPRAVDTPEKAITIALKGRELGIPMMQAFSHIHVIQGKPTISAELMLALIYKNCAGALINYVESTEKKCVIEARRPGHKSAIFTYTIEEAKQAGLLSKDSWRNYPGAMLRARAVSIVARAVFPDAIMGCSYTPEELGAEVDDEGEVIDITTPRKNAPKSEAPKQEPKQEEDLGAFVITVGKRWPVGERLDKVDQSDLYKWTVALRAWRDQDPARGTPNVNLNIDKVESYLAACGFDPRQVEQAQ